MDTMQHPAANPSSESTAKPAVTAESVEDRRARRLAALRKIAGMWAHRTDIPADGLEYERDMRAEWR